MDIANVVLTNLQEKSANNIAFADAENKDVQLKLLGVDSIQFLTIVLGICEELNLDTGKLDGVTISTENTTTEFIENFKAFAQAEAAAA